MLQLSQVVVRVLFNNLFFYIILFMFLRNVKETFFSMSNEVFPVCQTLICCFLTNLMFLLCGVRAFFVSLVSFLFFPLLFFTFVSVSLGFLAFVWVVVCFQGYFF